MAVTLILLSAATANAALQISVNDIVDPPGTPTVPVNGTAIIGLWGDGTTYPGTFYMGLTISSPASLTPPPPGDPIIILSDDPDLADLLGVKNLIVIEFPDSPPPTPLTGKIADNIIFHCEGLGNATILLFDGEGSLLDGQAIQQTPEPATIALLSLGALLLRRKSKI